MTESQGLPKVAVASESNVLSCCMIHDPVDPTRYQEWNLLKKTNEREKIVLCIECVNE